MQNAVTDKREYALRNEKIPRLIMKMSSPAIMAMMVMSIYNMADAFFMGMLGTEALGAATVGYPVFMILTALGLSLGMGGSSYQSRLLGEQKKDMAEKTVATIFITGMILGVGTALLTVPFAGGISSLFGANDRLLQASTDYIRILAIGSVFPVVSMCANNLLRGEGSAIHSLFGMGFGSILNIFLDPFLMFGLNLGVKGAALATVISQAIGMAILLSFYLRQKTLVHFHFAQFHPNRVMYGEILKVGGAVFLQQMLITLTMAVTNRAASALGGIKSGDAYVAAVGIINRLSMVINAVMMGFGQGLQPVIGYNYGARQYLRVRKSIDFAFGITAVFGLVVSVVSFLFPRALVSIFTSNPAVINPSAFGIRILGYAWPVAGFFFVTQVLFQALGRPKQALTLASVRQIFTLLCVWILPLFFGIDGFMSVICVSMILSSLVALILYLPYHRELNHLLPAGGGAPRYASSDPGA